MIAIDLEKLSKPEFLSQLQKEFESILFHLDEVEATKIVAGLSKTLRQATGLSDEIKNQYNDLLIRFQFIAIPNLTDDQVAGLLKNNLLIGLSLKDYDLLGQLKSFLGIFDPWTRDEPKQKIIEALRSNNEQIVSWDTDKTVAIRDWLIDYDRDLGIQPAENIKQISYFIRRFKNVSLDNQKILKDIFKIYEYLKINSQNIKNFDNEFIFTDDRGNIYFPQDGKLVLGYNVDKDQTINQKINITNEALPVSSLPPIKIPRTNQSFEEELLKPEVKIISPVSSDEPKNMDNNDKILLLISQLNLFFTDDVLKNRFINLLSSYLKGIRKETELRDALMRPDKTGGMGYDRLVVDSIFNILSGRPNFKQTISDSSKDIPSMALKPALAEGLNSPMEILNPTPPIDEKLLNEPEDILLTGPQQKTSEQVISQKDKFSSGALSSTIDNDLEKQLEQSMSLPGTEEKAAEPIKPAEDFLLKFDLSNYNLAPQEETISPETEPKIKLEQSLPPVIEQKLPEAPPLSPEPPSPAVIPEVPKSTPIPDNNITNIYSSSTPVVQPTIEEVKVTPKIYGPVDELRTIVLDDWRRWGSTSEAVKRILDKMNLLAEDSLVKKSQGISAWKESEINKLYMDIGTEAIDNGLSVEQAIEKRKKENRPTLTLEEFNAVAELNQKLRF